MAAYTQMFEVADDGVSIYERKQTTLWQFDRPFRNEYHPTLKPIPLISYPIKNSSKLGDIVFDLFGGSGSMLIACEETNRICYTVSLIPNM
ncbi:DNA methyltransferase [Paenibacillus polymyxa]|nr:DNA methyltransferase [Paenibacillus polymyxa]